jgi:hypothetical protein
MSNTTTIIEPEVKSNIMIINDGVFPDEDNGIIYYDDTYYTHYDPDTHVICGLFSKIKKESEGNTSFTIEDINHKIQLFYLENVKKNINPYQVGKYVWKKYCCGLTIPKNDMYINRISCRRIDENYFMIFCYNTSLYGTSNSSIRAYVYDHKNNKYIKLDNVNDSLFGNGKFASVDQNSDHMIFVNDNKLSVYMLSNFSSSGFDVTLKAIIDPVLNNSVIVPNYVSINHTHVAFATGNYSGTRYTLRTIRVFETPNVDLPGDSKYTERTSVDLSTALFMGINRTSCGMVIDINGSRICFINIVMFYVQKLNKNIPRYHISIYDLDRTQNKWALYKEMFGSFVDPTHLEGGSNIDPNKVLARKFKPEISAEYRNLYISTESDGEYISMWVPYASYNGEIIILKPNYERISSLVRVDDIKIDKTDTLDTTTSAIIPTTIPTTTIALTS